MNREPGSSCHRAPVVFVGGVDYKKCFRCTKCHKFCDIYSGDKEPASEEPKQKACECYCHYPKGMIRPANFRTCEHCQPEQKTCECCCICHGVCPENDTFDSCDHCEPDPSLSTWEANFDYIADREGLKGSGFATVTKTFIKKQISLAVQKERQRSWDGISKLKRKDISLFLKIKGLSQLINPEAIIAYNQALDDALAIVNKGVEEK